MFRASQLEICSTGLIYYLTDLNTDTRTHIEVLHALQQLLT